MNKTTSILLILILGAAIIALFDRAADRQTTGGSYPHATATVPQMSATEQWQLTQACADLGKKKLEERRELATSPPQYNYSVETHYGPAARRCYVLLFTESLRSTGTKHYQLFDGQTDEELAWVTFSEKDYLIGGSVKDSKHKLPEPEITGPENPAEANRRAERTLGLLLQDALDYINERMGREKFDALCKPVEGDRRTLTGPVECRDR